ncbi:hypothetical protein G7046_g1305 [Stylonectria norvegica]|nr:hypothetical protein G7046_g1305 [Stylonectria norvegica]
MVRNRLSPHRRKKLRRVSEALRRACAVAEQTAKASEDTHASASEDVHNPVSNLATKDSATTERKISPDLGAEKPSSSEPPGNPRVCKHRRLPVSPLPALPPIHQLTSYALSPQNRLYYHRSDPLEHRYYVFQRRTESFLRLKAKEGLKEVAQRERDASDRFSYLERGFKSDVRRAKRDLDMVKHRDYSLKVENIKLRADIWELKGKVLGLEGSLRDTREFFTRRLVRMYRAP